ncbi:MAG TPA: TolC family protein [Vicinamibacterales bacterium]|nr:TolC family protein [Vicinamibacterales bacterium]
MRGPAVCRRLGILATSLLLSGAAAAQDAPSAPAGVRRITLPQAQQLAAGANPLERLGRLQVEAAEQHRLGVKAQYFPSVSGQFENLHLTEQPGQVLTVQRPFAGTTLSLPVTVFAQDQSAVNVTVVQPITPLFQVRQLVKIARADENIARAKAGLPVAERASLVEKNYFDLLVAERELVSARVAVTKASAATLVSTARQAAGEKAALDAAKTWSLASSKVRELTATLDEMMGLPADTRLELVPPPPLVEHLSLDEAAVDATTSNAQVIEAEQTAVKARAGSMLARSAYVPGVAVIGGYTYQTAIADSVLPHDFAYVGVVATYTLFDSGKREHTVKELSAQVHAADLGVELTKAKVAAAVKTSYLELERSRDLVQLTRRIVAAPRVVDASYLSSNQDDDAARADMEAELFRAELEYRQAYARVRALIGDK